MVLLWYMKKENLWVSVSILLLFGLVLAGGLSLGKKYQHREKDTATTISFEEIEKIVIDKKEKGFDITVTYPRTGMVSIDSLVKKYIDASVDFFVTDFGSARLPEEDLYTFDADFQVHTGLHTVTFVYTISEYTGGAHGNHSIQTFTFDKNGNEVFLKDVLLSVDSGLTTISPFVQKELKKILEDMFTESWVVSGTAPSVENYTAFYLTEESIGFVFAPYQVAPYAAGIKEVRIPFAVFPHIFNSTYIQ